MNSENVEGTAQDTQGPEDQCGCPEKQTRQGPLTLTLTLKEVLPKSQVSI